MNLTLSRKEFIHLVNVFFWMESLSSCRALIRPFSKFANSSDVDLGGFVNVVVLPPFVVGSDIVFIVSLYFSFVVMGTLKYFVSWLVWHLLTFLTATLLLANYILTINNNKWMDGWRRSGVFASCSRTDDDSSSSRGE
jgi:hypothetical protein